MVKASDKSTQAIIEVANEWLVRLHDAQVTAADEAEFEDWLRESPVHVREYLRAECLWVALEGVDAQRRIDVAALLRDVPDNVRPLPASAMPATEQPPAATSNRRLHPAWFGAAAALVLSVIAGWWYTTLPQTESYATGLGEQRRLVLDDGSVIDMNTQSELAVTLTNHERSIELHGGEALFTVARDPSRPFVVRSGHATVQALGTQFNVYQRHDEVQVTVLEGRVTVASLGSRAPVANPEPSAPDHNQSVELNAGDAAELRPGAPIRKTAKVNTARTLAWTERRLIFDNEPLSAVVAEFNRYNPRQLVVEDAGIAAQRISAVFDADKPEALVRFLAQSTAIRVDEVSPSRILIQSADPDSGELR
jgi:transmembrane sensor